MASAILIFAFHVPTFGTAHGYVPVFGMLSLISTQFCPLSVEYSSLTVGVSPVEDQVILCVVPLLSDSPPFGDISVKDSSAKVNPIASESFFLLSVELLKE